jgi:hypothetical protein
LHFFRSGISAKFAWDIPALKNASNFHPSGYEIFAKKLLLDGGFAVFCKYFLDIVAKYFWTLLHVQIGQNCNGSAALYRADQYSHCRHYSIVTA